MNHENENCYARYSDYDRQWYPETDAVAWPVPVRCAWAVAGKPGVLFEICAELDNEIRSGCERADNPVCQEYFQLFDLVQGD